MQINKNPAEMPPVEQFESNLLIQGGSVATSDVIELLASRDSLTMKICCSYIANTCTTNSDLALLAANLLLRNASDANPAIRSASLSAMVVLPGLHETALKIVSTALGDQSPMVRRSATLASLQLHRHNPKLVLSSCLPDTLYRLIRDPDPIVVANALVALDSILFEEGGVVVKKSMVCHLLERINEFPSCSRVYVMKILGRYIAQSEEEILYFLNTLDDQLSATDPASVVGATHIVLKLAVDLSQVTKDVLHMVQPGICKILSRNIPETCYLLLVAMKTWGDIKDIFAPHYKCFLVRARDPLYLKSKKLEVLPSICTATNVGDIMEELRHLCCDVTTSESALMSLAALQPMNESTLSTTTEILATAMKSPIMVIQISALHCFLALLPSFTSGICEEKRQIPHSLSLVLKQTVSLGTLQQSHPSLLLRILAKATDCMEDVTEIVEQILSQRIVDICPSLPVCTALVFLAHPAKMQNMLGSILHQALTSSSPAVVEQGTLVYSILCEEASVARRLLSEMI